MHFCVFFFQWLDLSSHIMFIEYALFCIMNNGNNAHARAHKHRKTLQHYLHYPLNVSACFIWTKKKFKKLLKINRKNRKFAEGTGMTGLAYMMQMDNKQMKEKCVSLFILY